MITLLPPSRPGYGKSEREANPVPYLEYKYLFWSVVLVNLTAPNKQSFRVKSVLKSCDHVSDS